MLSKISVSGHLREYYTYIKNSNFVADFKQYAFIACLFRTPAGVDI